MSKKSTNLELAHEYSNLEWSVLPLHGIEDNQCTCGNSACPSPGKHAAFQLGAHAATMDSAYLKLWFAKWPRLNIGIATGDTSGLLVLNVDKDKGGFESLAAAICETGPLPECLIAKTGGGGEHLYFFLPDRNIVTDVRGKLVGPGVDVLVDGSYVVAPGSRHVSGKKYKWKNGAPDETRLPGFLSKAWIRRLLGPPSIAVAVMDGDIGDVFGRSGTVNSSKLGHVHLGCRGRLHFAFNYGRRSAKVPASAGAVFLVGLRELAPGSLAVWIED